MSVRFSDCWLSNIFKAVCRRISFPNCLGLTPICFLKFLSSCLRFEGLSLKIEEIETLPFVDSSESTVFLTIALIVFSSLSLFKRNSSIMFILCSVSLALIIFCSKSVAVSNPKSCSKDVSYLLDFRLVRK